MSQSNLNEPLEGIAIIGLSGRFPGAGSVDEFWRNIKGGVESISRFSDEELAAEGIGPETLRDPAYVKAGGVLEGAELFDASFFGFTPREAELTDPQHRIFLECAWEALENAGYDSEATRGPIGVYAGVSLNTYLLNNLLSNFDLQGAGVGVQAVIGNDKDHVPARVSYKFNLTGPSVCVQTACSSSLVALHMACQGLMSGDCELALAGGVSITVPVRAGYFYQEGGVYSPDGCCRAFDAEARGTVGGSGVGIVVVKRLEDALADGDCIHAVIKGSAINNDGSAKVGYTAPSIEGQAEAIAMAQAMAGVEPESVALIEAHGTGTALGDPIEFAALTQVFRAGTDKKSFCALGSVKTNVGHLDAAAGVTGLVKAVLALKYQQLPPSLHFKQPNPEMDFANSPFYVNTKLSKWESDEAPRRAGVSSFGMGGTNAHVVLEQAPPRKESSESRPLKLLVLSAKTDAALQHVTTNLAEHLKGHRDLSLADAAYTLQIGRRRFDHRRVLVCRDTDDALVALESLDPKRAFSEFQPSADRPVVFMFPGQGAQYVNMGLELFQTESVFREHVEHCAEVLEPVLKVDLRGLLYPAGERTEAAAHQLRQTSIAQPALFVIEYALAQLWSTWGVRPRAMIGHSIGEYVAACLAGVYSLEDALTLVAARGQLIQRLPAGAMLAVALPVQEVESLLGEHLSLAAVNGPALCVVSGPTEAVDRLESKLEKRGLAPRRLHTSHAFHSEMVEPVLEPFAEQVRAIRLNAPKIPYISNLTGTWITTAEATDPNYWVRHLRQTVRFSAGVQTLLQTPETILLEVGPGRTLQSLARRHPEKAPDRVVLSSIRHPEDRDSDATFLLNTLGRLWLAGAPVDWPGFYANERRRRVPLPTYPFERQRYWIESRGQAGERALRHGVAEKKSNIADWFYLPSWKRTTLSVPTAGLVDQPSCWLLFRDRCGLASGIETRLKQQQQDVVTVIAGEKFSKLAEHQYTINPRHRDDYEALLSELIASDRIPQRVVHFWSVTSNDAAPSSVESFEQAQDAGLYSLLFLAQAIGKKELTDAIQITVVSNNLHDVTGDEVLCPEKMTLLGPCKVLPQEYVNISCSSVDIVLPQPGSRQEKQLIEQLLEEVDTKSTDPVVAYRGPHRWQQQFETIRLESAHERPSGLQQQGVYLITGGLGDVGLMLAGTLARSVQAKLVLIGRSQFPAREQWDQWLVADGPAERIREDVARRTTGTAPNDFLDRLSGVDKDEGRRIAKAIRKLQELEALGSEVLILRADVADLEQMQSAMKQIGERFGEINGVIHGAAHTAKGAFSLIQDTGSRQCQAQFHAKVYGLMVLKKVLSGKDLDFTVLLSSTASILGGLKSVAYTSANLFMEAFAQKYHDADGTPWMSTTWDRWSSEEGEQQSTAFGRSAVQFAMTPKEGTEAFERVLSLGGVSQVTISTGDLQSRMDQWLKRKPLEEIGQIEQVKASPRHARPVLKNEYVAPDTAAEQALAGIWAESLGVEQVGAHDNFFELGGDSVLSLQIIAKANQAGLRITPKQIFEHQTIAELAKVASTTRRVEAEQGAVTGHVPLAPIQHWFFEQDFPDLENFCFSYTLELQGALELEMLEQVMERLVAHHDALRLRYVKERSGWQQVTAGGEARVPVTRIDLSKMSAAEQDLAFEEAASELQNSLNLSQGPIMAVALFDLGGDQTFRLLWTIHHLAVDALSWRILLEDFRTALEQLREGKPIQLPPKTTSFQHWTERLGEYGQSESARRELEYWLALPWARTSLLPVDFSEGVNSGTSIDTVSVSLSVEETHTLVHEVPKAFNTQTADVLLTALAQAFSQWTGTHLLRVDLEGDGREGMFEELDWSRTVGWFTNLYPTLLDLRASGDPADVLKSIKEQLRRIPNQGNGYGSLRYLSRDAKMAEKIRALPPAQVMFDYLGPVDQVFQDPAPFGMVPQFRGSAGGLPEIRAHLLEIGGLIRAERLHLDWTYSKNLHRRATIERLAEDYLEALRTLIAHCQSSDASGYTPSDFPDVDLSQKELDRFIDRITQKRR